MSFVSAGPWHFLSLFLRPRTRRVAHQLVHSAVSYTT
jgi:hypothetical protein